MTTAHNWKIRIVLGAAHPLPGGMTGVAGGRSINIVGETAMNGVCRCLGMFVTINAGERAGASDMAGGASETTVVACFDRKEPLVILAADRTGARGMTVVASGRSVGIASEAGM